MFPSVELCRDIIIDAAKEFDKEEEDAESAPRTTTLAM